MGIYIPNMERPESCDECRFHRYDWGNEYIPSADRCSALLIRFNEISVDVHTSEETLPDCPIIGIVTCGECKHWYNDADCGMACEFTNMKQPIDGFCNWGERRSDEPNTERN